MNRFGMVRTAVFPSAAASNVRLVSWAIALACAALASPRTIRAQDSSSVAPTPRAASRTLTLQQAVELAQTQGFQARSASSTRSAARARERAFFARFLPQLSLFGSLPDYNRSIIPVVQPDGSTLFRAQQQTTGSANMILEQRIPFTGGTLQLSSLLQEVKRTGTSNSVNWNSTPYAVRLVQPILRSNAFGWDTRSEGLTADIADRQYTEAREDVALQATEAFFNFYAARTTLRNATSNVAINDTLFRLNHGRFEVGKIGENDLGQSELQLLRARNALDQAKLDFDRAEAALRLALNVGPTETFDVVVPTEIPDFTADTALAVAEALRNRSQILSLALQDVQAARRISEARWNNGPGANLVVSYGTNGAADERQLVYRDLQPSQRFQLGVQMPLVMWGAHSADIQAAKADRESVRANSQATREQVRQEAHFAALQLDLARRSLAISAKADTVAAKRYEVAYNRYVIGRIAINDLFVAQNDKDQALLGYVNALRAYWTAYYRLRRLTLYDFEKRTQLE